MADITLGLAAFAETDVALAGTCDIGAVSTVRVRITPGTGPITSFGTSANKRKEVRAGVAFTLTHNGVSLGLPTAADIAVEVGDTFVAMSGPSGNWIVTSYQRKSGKPLAYDTDLAAIEALSPSNDDLLQRKAGAWTNRTIAQLAADLQAAGYGNTWGDPIASKTFAVDGAASSWDFTGLSAYRELLLVGHGIAHAGADQNFLARVSNNNGSSFASTGYVNTGLASATSGLFVATAFPSSAILTFELEIRNFNSATYKATARSQGGREGSATGPYNIVGRYDTAQANNALRFLDSGAVNLTAYEIRLYGKKG